MNKSFFDEIKEISPFVSYYSVICGFLYLYIFWYFKFGVYPFEYIGLLDVLALSGKFLVFVSGFIFFMTTYHTYKGDDGFVETKSHKNLIGYTFFAVIIFFVIPLAFSHKYASLEAIAASALLSLVMPIFRSTFLRDSINNFSLRMAVVSTLIIMPLGSIFMAITESNRIIHTHNELISFQNSKSICVSDCVFIGKLGDYFAVLNNSGTVVMITKENVGNFVLTEKKKVN